MLGAEDALLSIKLPTAASPEEAEAAPLVLPPEALAVRLLTSRTGGACKACWRLEHMRRSPRGFD